MRAARRLIPAAAAAAVILWVRQGPTEPLTYTPHLETPGWTSGGPAVLIDDAHWNLGAGQTQLASLAALMRADGYRVLTDGNATRAEMLADAKIAVIVNPLGLLGLARRMVAPLGLAGWTFFDDDGLLTQEIETTLQWIDNGGSLLLAVDPAPIARGSRGLAARLGVGLHERPVVDGEAGPSQIVEAPPGGTALGTFGPSAVELPRAGASRTEGASAAGRPWAVAFDRGRGRVVVLGTSQVLKASVNAAVGIQDADHERLVRGALRWLARGDPLPSRRSTAEKSESLENRPQASSAWMRRNSRSSYRLLTLRGSPNPRAAVSGPTSASG